MINVTIQNTPGENPYSALSSACPFLPETRSGCAVESQEMPLPTRSLTSSAPLLFMPGAVCSVLALTQRISTASFLLPAPAAGPRVPAAVKHTGPRQDPPGTGKARPSGAAPALPLITAPPGGGACHSRWGAGREGAAEVDQPWLRARETTKEPSLARGC